MGHMSDNERNRQGIQGVPEWTMADRLRKVRELTGLDQSEFASLIGVSRGTVSTYESNPHAAHKRPYLLAWAYYTHTALEWIETGQEPAPDADPFRGASLPDNDRCSSLTLHLPKVRRQPALA